MRFSFVLAFLVLMTGLAFASPPCPSTLTTNTVMDADVTGAGTCYTIGANSITLDCNGHTITHTGTENALHYGVTATTRSNIVIKNCIISNFTGLNFITNSNNALFLNNTITAGKLRSIVVTTAQDTQILNSSLTSFWNYSIVLTTVKRANITNNTITAWHNVSTYGLYMTDARNATIFNNTIITNASLGFYEARSTQTNFSNNTIATNYGTALTIAIASNHSTYFGNYITTNRTGYGIYIDTYSTNNTIDNTTVRTNNSIGIYIYRSNNNTIKFSTVITNMTAVTVQITQANSTRIFNTSITNNFNAIALQISTSKFNEISNSTLTSNTSYGLSLLGTAGTGNNRVQNNTFTNNTATSATSYATYVNLGLNNTFKNHIAQVRNAGSAMGIANSNYTTILNTTLLGNVTYGLYTSGAYYTTFTNSTSSTIGSSSVGIYMLNSRWNTFENVTVNGTAGYGVVFNTAYDNVLKNMTILTNPATRREAYFFRSGNNTIYNSSLGIIPSAGRIAAGCNSNATLVNTTFNRSNILFASYTTCPSSPLPLHNETVVKWYMNFSVTTTNGSAASNTNIVVNATVKPFGSMPLNLEVFNNFTDADGNYNDLIELTEFLATGYFKYNGTEYPQVNLTVYNNHTILANKTDYFINWTNATVNRSYTPFSISISPVTPRILEIGLNKHPPIFESAVNDTIPYAIVTDVPAGTTINFTVWNSSNQIVYFNQANVSANFTSNTYYGVNFTTYIQGTWRINITAYNAQVTVNKSWTFDVVNESTLVGTCPWVLSPYRHYIVPALGLVCIQNDGIIAATGAYVKFKGNIAGVSTKGDQRGVVISGVNNFTMLSEGGEFGIAAFGLDAYINTSNNITCKNISLTATRFNVSLYVNGTDGFQYANSTINTLATNANPAIMVLLSKNSIITNLTGDSGLSSYLFMANTTNVNFTYYTTATVPAIQTVLNINDANYSALGFISISNLSRTDNALAPHTYIKCERCNWAELYALTLTNGAVGMNLTGSSHTKAVGVVGVLVIPILSTVVSTSVFQGFTDSAILIYSLGTQAFSNNNSFYNYYIANSTKAVALESLASWTVTNTTMENFTITVLRPTAFATYGVYSANASNTTILNSSIIAGAIGGIFPAASIRENTLATITGLTFMFLKNTTVYNLTGTSINASMNANPDMNFHVGWGAELTATSDTGSTQVSLNITNVTGEIIANVSTGVMNTTYWMGVLPQGFFNKTSLPNAYFNQSNHTFKVGAIGYNAVINLTNLTMSQPRNVNLWLFFSPSGCGDITTNTILTQNITIDSPVCFKLLRSLTFDCDGYWIISPIAGVIGIAAQSASANPTIIKNCNFNTTGSGSYLAAINISTSEEGVYATNNSFSLNGNITNIGSNHVHFANSNANVILGVGDISILVATPTYIYNITIENTTITANSVEGGTAIYSYIPSGSLFVTGLNLTNVTIHTLGNVSTAMQSVNVIMPNYFENVQFILDNQNNSAAIIIDNPLSSLSYSHGSMNTTTNRSIWLGSSTTFSTRNVTTNISEAVIGASSSWTNAYPINIHVIYSNGTDCGTCEVNYTDNQGGQGTYGNTAADGYLYDLNLTQFDMEGGAEETYFQLNGSDQTNGTTNLLYYSPYIFTSQNADSTYTGSNMTNITNSGEVVIMLQADVTKTCGTLTANTTLVQNVLATSDCYTLDAENITLDCDGYSIIGSGVGTAIVDINRGGIVKNCFISNFGNGTYIGSSYSPNSINIYLINNTFTNMSEFNIRISGSKYVHIYNNSIVNSTSYALYTEPNSAGLLVANSTMHSLGASTVYIDDSNDNYTLRNLTILSDFDFAIYFQGALSNSLFDNIYANGATIGVQSGTVANGIVFKNLTANGVDLAEWRGIIYNSSISHVINLGTGGGGISIVNTSFNRANITAPSATGSLNVSWYANFSVLNLGDGASVNATPIFGGQSLFNGTADANGFITPLTEFIEFIANGSFIYNESSDVNYTTYNNWNFSANKTGVFGTNVTNVNESGTIVIVLNSLFSQTNYSWIQNTNITEYVEANWSRKIYTDGSGIANASLLMNRTGAIWLLNGSGSYKNFMSNGSNWAAWNTTGNVSQNWTVVMQTKKMPYSTITLTWGGRSNAKICEITAPFYTNYTFDVLIGNESESQELRTCYGDGYAAGGDCDLTLEAMWGSGLSYKPIPNYLYRNKENLTMNRYYILLWDTGTGGSGGGGPSPQPPTGIFGLPLSLVSVEGVVALPKTIFENMLMLIRQNNFPSLFFGMLLLLPDTDDDNKRKTFYRVLWVLGAAISIISLAFITGGLV